MPRSRAHNVTGRLSLRLRRVKSSKLYPSAHCWAALRAAAQLLTVKDKTTHLEIRGGSFMNSADPVMSLGLFFFLGGWEGPAS